MPSKHKRSNGHVAPSQPAPAPVYNEFEIDERDERVIDTVDKELDADRDEEDVMDEGKAAHDTEALKSVKGQAIAAALAMGMSLTPDEESIALNLFPKVLHFSFTRSLTETYSN